MVGDAAGQFDGGGVGKHADVDLGQREPGMFCGIDEVTGECQFEPAADRHAVDRGNDRFVECGQFLQAAEPADAVVRVRRFAIGRDLEVPSGREKTLSGAGQQRHTQVRVIAEPGEHVAHDLAGGGIDGVRFGPVQGDLKDGAVAPCVNGISR